MERRTSRLAPSPTGALHLGNARTFLLNHLLARKNNWRMLLRIEDLDGPRVKPGATGPMIEELRWLGLQWQGEAVYQSQRADIYRRALEQLIRAGMAYPCTCSRKDVEQAASAPHRGEAVAAYPGTCRGKYASAAQAAATGRPVAWRLKTGGQRVAWDDLFAGHCELGLDDIGGDFVLFKSDGLAAYQLAVVIDDAAFGVDAIVRGDDLLDSAARQIYLRRLLGIGPDVEYWHLPLIVGGDGRRLAKRHGDTRVGFYRQAGASPERILGLLGFWSGLLPSRRQASMEELLERFDLAAVPRGPVVFTADDDDFLRSGG